MAEPSAPLPESKWIAELDYLRGFAIIAVLMNHISTYDISQKSLPVAVLNIGQITFSSLGVLTFFFISGMVLANKYYPSVPVRAFYKKRLSTVVPPYLVISTAFIILFAYLFTAPSSSTVVLDYLTGSADEALWFVVVILQFYILYPLIVALYRNFETRGFEGRFVLLSLAVQVSWNLLSQLLVNADTSAYLDRVFLSYLFFFVFGMYIARRRGKFYAAIREAPWSLLLSLTAVTFFFASLAVYAFSKTLNDGLSHIFIFYTVASLAWPMLSLTSYKASLILSERKGFWPEVMKKLGKASFSIYLLHIFVLIALTDILGGMGVDKTYLIFYPVALLGTLFITYLLVRVLSRIPHSELLIGRN